MQPLTDIACWDLLRSQRLGRISVVIPPRPGTHRADTAPEIFPVNYAVGENAIAFLTAPGTKLSAALGRASFEIDGYDPETRTAWSVVAKGMLHEITDGLDDRSTALRELPLHVDAPGEHAHRMALFVNEVTGRRFTPRE